MRREIFGVILFAAVMALRPGQVPDTDPQPAQEVVVIDEQIGAPAEPVQKPTIVINTEPAWCVPCKRLERDGVPDALRKSGWTVEIRGGEGGVVPRFLLKVGKRQEKMNGYTSKERLYEWIKRSSNEDGQ